MEEIKKKKLIGIAVDASTVNGNPGFTECRGIDLETGEIVFDEQIGFATNNLGEIFAIAYAIEYRKSKNLKTPIYSDSKIAISWARQKIVKTNIFRDYPQTAEKNPQLAQKIMEAEEILQSFNEEIKIEFWNKWHLGENPADYNRKQPKNFNFKKRKKPQTPVLHTR